MNNIIEEKSNTGKWGLSSFALKILAVVCMTFDHIGTLYFTSAIKHLHIPGIGSIAYPTNVYSLVLRGIGRIAFPLFVFLLVEGFCHTKNKARYMIRLGIFAFLSEIPFDIFTFKKIICFTEQNVMFTLFICFAMLWVLESANMCRFNYPAKLVKKIGMIKLTYAVEFLTVVTAFAAAWLSKCSYSYGGVFLALAFYALRGSKGMCFVANAFFNIGLYANFALQWTGCLSAVPIALYNGKPGKMRLKYFFYVYYPVHLVVLVLLRMYVIKPFS